MTKAMALEQLDLGTPLGDKPEFSAEAAAEPAAEAALEECAVEAEPAAELPEALHPYLRGKTRLGADGVLA